MDSNLAIERVPIDTLHLDPANARLHPDENLDAIEASLRRFGQAEPLVVQASTGRVIGGNGRLVVMKKLGWTACDVVRLDIDDLTATGLAIALNRTAETAVWDEATLGKLLQELQAEQALDGVGFTEDEIDTLLANLDDPTAEIEDPGPDEPPENPVSRRGDLWILGEHRLLCGDSTHAEDVARLMAEDQAVLLSTDPPYCVNYTGMDRPIHDGKPSGKDWSHVYHEVEIADLGQFLDAVFSACLPHVTENAGIYIWHAHVQQPVIAATFEKHGLLLHQVLVWVKPTATFGHSYYRWRHEPCAFGWRRGHKPNHGLGKLESVWEIDWEGKSRVVGNEHPCLHPESRVLTESGFRQIQTISEGDRVYTADGTFHRIAAVTSHPYTSDHLYRIVVRGGNEVTMASDNHPFLVWRPERRGQSIVSGECLWVTADQLRVGDYTMTPVLAHDGDDPFPGRSEDYWFLLGLFVAEGSFQKAGHGRNLYPAFAINASRRDLVDRIRKHWGDRVREYEPPSNAVTVMAFDPESGAEFLHLVGKLAHAKRLAPEILGLPEAKRRALFEGWMNGDGCNVRTYRQASTVSPNLAAQMALLAESVGYKSNVFRVDPTGRESFGERKFKHVRPCYRLYFYNADTPRSRGTGPTSIEHNGHKFILRYVKAVEPVPYTGDVWNLSVCGNPTFQTAVGMSHNTQKPLRLFEIPMEQHTQLGQIVMEPFSGSGSQILAAERLGRKCRAMEIQPAFVDVAIRRWEKATGKKAYHEGTNLDFEEVAKERESRKGGA